MPEDFITVPFEVDPEELNALATDYLQAQVPGWQPTPGDLLTIALEGAAFIVAELTSTASDVPAAIFRVLGAKLHGIPPGEASAASADSTWTMVDDAGYTIPSGAQVGIEAANGELIGFEVVADVTVAPGDTATAAGEVALVAIEEGEAGSGLTNDPELVDSLSFVESIELVGVTTGGEDAEMDDDYLARLSAEFELLTPRPILTADFAVLARRVNGVERATAIDLYGAGTNEIQRVEVVATGGTFTLTFSGQTTAAIPFDASAAAIQAKLEALLNINVGDVSVTGGPLDSTPVLVEFRGQHAGSDVGQMTDTDTALTRNEKQRITVTGATDGTFDLTFDGQTTTIDVDADAAYIQAQLETLSNIAPGDVAVLPGHLLIVPVDVEFTGAYAGTDVAEMTVSNNLLNPGGASVAVSTIQESGTTSATVTTEQTGVAPDADVERTVSVALMDETGEPVGSTIRAEVDALLQAMREVNFVVTVIDATYTLIDVVFTAVAWPGWDAELVEAAAEAAVNDYLSPADWGQQRSSADTRSWHNVTKVRYLEVSEVINSVEGLHYIEDLGIGIDGDPTDVADLDLEGAAPLPRPGTVTGSVTVP